jgi:isopenicillin N synthase-like dioxygenase
MQVYTPPRQAALMPVIDISANEAEAAAGIGKACREIGFFYVCGHGIPEDLIARQFAAAKAVFTVPESEKRALHMRNSVSASGFEPIGGQILDSQDSTGTPAPPDLKESYYCTTNAPEDGPRRPTTAQTHNQWPAGNHAFKAQTLAYGEAVQALGDRILELLALSLDLPKNWFEPFYAGAAAKLRMLRYPPQTPGAQFNQIGAGAHTDWGGITLLAQDSLGGLEVRDVHGTWVRADPIPGTFVINLGDLMMRWTNGVYASNFHRVRNNDSAQERYSLPFFYSPHGEARIQPIPSCVTAQNPRRFADCTAQEHVREMFKRSYGYAS